MKILLKIVAFIVGLVMMLFLVICSNKELFKVYSDWIPNPYRYGDLYFFSNLPEFRSNTKEAFECESKCEAGNSFLTIIGDSYTRSLESSNFDSGAYQFYHWDNVPLKTPLLRQVNRNVIVVATTERYCRWRLLCDSLFTSTVLASEQKPAQKESLLCDEELKFLLTNHDFILPIKELRSTIRYQFFQTVDERVAFPDNSGRLYLGETIDSSKNASSYQIVSDAEILRLQNNLIKLNQQLHEQGYDEVYFSIIPNAASIYRDAAHYNHLIERIENIHNEEIHFIDLYGEMKSSTENCFLVNDSHWNNHGKRILVDRVNALLCRESPHAYDK